MFKKSLAIACVLALMVFASSAGPDDAEAGSGWIPIFGDTYCASVSLGDVLLVAPPSLLDELQAHTGETATYGRFDDAVARHASASAGGEVRMYASFALGSGATVLESKGYDTVSYEASDMPGADGVAVHTD